METSKRSVKLNEVLYKKLKKLATQEGKWIGHLLDKSVINYLKARKVEV